MSQRQSKQNRSKSEESSPANLTYYIVVLVAGMIGFMSYNAGSSLESALSRVIVALVACTVLGYAANLILWASAPGRQADDTTRGASHSSHVGTRVNLVAGDDEEPHSAARHSAAG